MVIVLYLAALAVLFFVLIVVPQRRQLSARKVLVASLRPGDRIVTAGGMYGTIQALDDETIRLEIAPDVEIEIARQAVNSRISEAPENPGSAANAGGGGDVAAGETSPDTTAD